jgi:hypothetical protein
MMSHDGEDIAPLTTVRARWWELALVALAGSILLCSLIFYFDNVHRATTNGLWKSLDVVHWVDRSAERSIDPSNLLYYPVVGTLVRGLPSGTFGTVWQRMAFVNAFLGAAVLTLIYAIAIRLFQSRRTALIACLSQMSMGFFLLLSTINEDIMPGYVWFVAAIACAIVPRRPGPLAIVLTAQCAALAWLFHWSLMLPTIGSLVIGIAAGAGSVRQAAGRAAIFCAALVPLPVISAGVFDVPWFAAFWAGKGLETGYAGFSANKLILMWSALRESIAGGRNLSLLATILEPSHLVATGVTIAVGLVLFLVWCREGWRHRTDPTWRLAAGVLVSAFALGEGMNLYSQPQDPQMQLQPMTWFPFAVACLYALTRGRPGVAPRLARASVPVALLLLLAGNVRVYASERHVDSEALANIAQLESIAPPERTMFLMNGSEGMATWLTVGWGLGIVWPNDEHPTPSTHQRRFNVIYVASEATVFPTRPASISAENIVRLVERALAEQWNVVANDVWAMSEDGWVDSFSAISSPEKPKAIYAALHERFTGTPLGAVPGWTSLYQITPKER